MRSKIVQRILSETPQSVREFVKKYGESIINNMTLKIEIPEGYEIDSFDKLSGEIKFKEKPKSITERIQTVEDILADHNINLEEFDDETGHLEEDERAYIIIKLLAKSLNEGWTPDWDNPNQYKYYPWFEMGGSSGFRFYDCASWASGSDVGSRHCFKTRELAEYAGKQFTSVYKQLMLI